MKKHTEYENFSYFQKKIKKLLEYKFVDFPEESGILKYIIANGTENLSQKQQRIFDKYVVAKYFNMTCAKCGGNYSAPKIPGIMQEFQQRQVLQLQRRLFHVFLLSRYKNGF